MARLPEPKLVSVEVTWPEDYKSRQKTFYEILGQAIRRREKQKKEEEEKKNELK